MTCRDCASNLVEHLSTKYGVDALVYINFSTNLSLYTLMLDDIPVIDLFMNLSISLSLSQWQRRCIECQ